MRYEYKPIEFKGGNKPKRLIGFTFEINTHDYCTDSIELRIFISIIIYKQFSLWIRPFGSLQIK